MDKQNVKLKTHELEVIGQGEMVYEPCQVGEWWVMPVEMYTEPIPPEAMKKWEDFKLYTQFFNIKVVGYLIADDMREVIIEQAKEAQKALELERKAEQERQRQSEIEAHEAQIRRQKAQKEADEATKKALAVAAGIAGLGLVVATGGALLLGMGLLAAIRFDPILIAVCEDGRWICIAVWWNDTEV